MRLHRNGMIPANLTPSVALNILKEGNFRFVNNLNARHDLLEQVNETKNGQWPFAAILSCMDSRTSAELIFDQGLGDIFSIRIAGNVVTPGILGSLEYATAVAGSKLIMVLGHTSCGAVKGACDNVQLGHLTSLINQIRPSVEAEDTVTDNRDSGNPVFVDAVARVNVLHSVHQIMDQSTVIRDLVDQGKIGIVPGLYDVATGLVTIFESDAILPDRKAAMAVN